MILGVNPLEHVLDTSHWHLLETIGLGIKLPWPFTKFVILEILAAIVICACFIPLARRVRNGEPAKGPFWNALEGLLTFVRNEVAISAIGEHDADKFLPFLWTTFLFILVNNLLGMFPFLGSPTSSILVTGALALCSAAVIHGAAIAKHGPIHYIRSYYPHIDAPGGFFLGIFIASIEIFGHVIKAVVLAIRLFANIFAGHTVLAIILTFIVLARNAPSLAFWPISVGSVVFIVALSLLELFVAFLQAYVFTYLTSLFLGSTLHPEH
jgi:F-type H+-transporting ATPase subunit a